MHHLRLVDSQDAEVLEGVGPSGAAGDKAVAGPQAVVPLATLPFPTAAVHVLNRERIGRLTTPVQNAEASLSQLEAGINKHLERAQQLVNQLHEDVENFKFPAPDNTPPSGRAA